MSGWVDEAAVLAARDAFNKHPGDPPGLEDVYDWIAGWFRQAAAKGRGLVSFYH